jgi:hypothetical protein
MSPRSEEGMAEARQRLALARLALEGGLFTGVVGAAYCAALYAARAALSEEDSCGEDPPRHVGALPADVS